MNKSSEQISRSMELGATRDSATNLPKAPSCHRSKLLPQVASSHRPLHNSSVLDSSVLHYDSNYIQLLLY